MRIQVKKKIFKSAEAEREYNKIPVLEREDLAKLLGYFIKKGDINIGIAKLILFYSKKLAGVMKKEVNKSLAAGFELKLDELISLLGQLSSELSLFKSDFVKDFENAFWAGEGASVEREVELHSVESNKEKEVDVEDPDYFAKRASLLHKKEVWFKNRYNELIMKRDVVGAERLLTALRFGGDLVLFAEIVLNTDILSHKEYSGPVNPSDPEPHLRLNLKKRVMAKLQERMTEYRKQVILKGKEAGTPLLFPEREKSDFETRRLVRLKNNY